MDLLVHMQIQCILSIACGHHINIYMFTIAYKYCMFVSFNQLSQLRRPTEKVTIQQHAQEKPPSECVFFVDLIVKLLPVCYKCYINAISNTHRKGLNEYLLSVLY